MKFSVFPMLRNACQDWLRSSPIGLRIAKGTLWSVIGAVFSRAFAVLTSILVARYLGKQGFGEYGIIQSTVVMMGVFASLSTGLTATRYVAQFRTEDPGKVGRILGGTTLVSLFFGGVISLGLVVLAPLLARHTLAAPHLSEVLRIAAPSLFLSTLNGVQVGALAGFESFRALSKIHFFTGLASFVGMTAGVVYFGLPGVMWGYNASLLISCLLTQRVLKSVMRENGIRFDYRESRQELKVLWNFSLPAMLANSLIGPVTWICNTMLVNQPNGYAEMGVYNAATQWRQLMLFLPGMVTQVVLPVMASSCRQKSVSQQLWINFWINLTLSLPLLLLLTGMSGIIMGAYGTTFSVGWYTFVLVQVATFLQVIQSPVITFWAISGQMWTNFFANLTWSVTLIVLSWLLIHRGASGLALALVISFCIFGVIMLALIPRTIRKFTREDIHELPTV